VTGGGKQDGGGYRGWTTLAGPYRVASRASEARWPAQRFQILRKERSMCETGVITILGGIWLEGSVGVELCRDWVREVEDVPVRRLGKGLDWMAHRSDGR
jgi:hypothetical protein